MRNLSVASSIELCNPPKRIFTAPTTIEYLPYGVFENIEDEKYLTYSFTKGDAVPPHLGYRYPYLLGEENEEGLTEAISKQIWAASIAADPGYGAVLNQDFTAAYGPNSGYQPLDGYISERWDVDADGNFRSELKNYPWDIDMNSWWLSYWQEGLIPVIGNQFVGNYFTIEQYLSNTQGVSKRHFDISSPWNHGYLHEDMSVVGKAEVKEIFEMRNLPAGSDNFADWWEIERTENRKNHKPLYDKHLEGTLTDYYEPTYLLFDDNMDEDTVEMVSGPIYFYYLFGSGTWVAYDPDYIPDYDEEGNDLSGYTELEQNLINELWAVTISPSGLGDGSEAGLRSRLLNLYNPYTMPFKGNYYSINDYPGSSSGGPIRYADYSNPFSYGYFMEDMSTGGKSDTTRHSIFGSTPLNGANTLFNFWNLF